MATAADKDGDVAAAHAVPKGLAFHPCAPGLIASRGLRKIFLFDLTKPDVPCLSIGGSTTFDGVSGKAHAKYYRVEVEARVLRGLYEARTARQCNLTC